MNKQLPSFNAITEESISDFSTSDQLNQLPADVICIIQKTLLSFKVNQPNKYSFSVDEIYDHLILRPKYYWVTKGKIREGLDKLSSYGLLFEKRQGAKFDMSIEPIGWGLSYV